MVIDFENLTFSKIKRNDYNKVLVQLENEINTVEVRNLTLDDNFDGFSLLDDFKLPKTIIIENCDVPSAFMFIGPKRMNTGFLYTAERTDVDTIKISGKVRGKGCLDFMLRSDADLKIQHLDIGHLEFENMTPVSVSSIGYIPRYRLAYLACMLTKITLPRCVESDNLVGLINSVKREGNKLIVEYI